MIRYDMTRHDMTRHDMTRHDIEFTLIKTENLTVIGAMLVQGPNDITEPLTVEGDSLVYDSIPVK